MNIDNIQELGNIITENLKLGIPLYSLKSIFEQYNGTDWCNCTSFCPVKYTKKIIFANEIIDIIVICWNVKQQSGIHDHPENGCLLKMLNGNLTECLYDKSLTLTHTNYLTKNDITYRQGKHGLHNIKNEHSEPAISLHIYSPPNYKPNFYNL
jgi:cysteine dioxygenase